MVGQTYIYAFSRRFYPKRLTVHSGYTFSLIHVFPGNRTHNLFALLTQCSTTKPHRNTYNLASFSGNQPCSSLISTWIHFESSAWNKLFLFSDGRGRRGSRTCPGVCVERWCITLHAAESSDSILMSSRQEMITLKLVLLFNDWCCCRSVDLTLALLTVSDQKRD